MSPKQPGCEHGKRQEIRPPQEPARLLLGAVGGHVLGEVDRRQRRAAARARLSLPAMDLERHRHLVRDLGADRLLVVLDRGAEDVEGCVQPLDLIGIELRAFLERGEARLPEDLVDPGAADPGDVPLVAQQWVQVTRLGDRGGEVVERGRGPGLRSQARDHLVLVDGIGAQQLRPGPLLGPELAQPQLAAVAEPDQDPRCFVFERGAFVEDAQPLG